MKDEARRPREVVVLGAGLAGLAAAWELEEAGHEVTVLEARSRPGGRVETLREPFAGDLHVEAGAIFFGVGYTEADRYIDELGLERAPVAVPDLRQLYHLRGRRFAVPESERPRWPYDLSPDEQGRDPEEFVERYVAGTLPPEVSRPASWSEAPLAELDELTIAQYMREQGASEGALNLLRHTRWWGAGMEAASALSSALADVQLWGGEPPFVLPDGNDRLPAAMADRLGDRVRYGVEVTGLREEGDGVEVRARRGSRHESRRADRVVCTLPATVLSEVTFEPDLPAEKRAAVRDLPYLDTTRIFLQVDRCFWYDEGVTGSAWTDLPIREVARQPGADPGGPREPAVLECHVRGPSARPLAGRPDDDVLDEVLRHLEEVHPAVRDHREGGVVRAWSEDPWARSAYSWPAPGDVTRHLEPLQRPHGRIHFAGEHTSVLRGTMEGALRSGIRAAEEVDEVLGNS